MWVENTILTAALVAGAHAIPPTTTHLSRPHQTTVTLHVLTNSNASALAPGYIFMAPFRGYLGYGPTIYQQDGELVWGGNASVIERAVDLHVCDYLGTTGTHLCYNDGNPHSERAGHSEGYVRFFDNQYQPLQTYGRAGNLVKPDIHEFNAYDAAKGNRFITDIYQPVSGYDLRPYGGVKDGWVYSGCFQDRNTATGRVLFQWCSLPHVSPKASYFTLQAAAGQGASRSYAWDYFHINAIDRNTEGDYLVSSRTTHSLYKVAGPNHPHPGSIIWILGGKDTSFDMLGNLNFSAQHHCRFRSTGNPVSVVSLFNNGVHANVASDALYIEINNATNTARLIQQYINPAGGISGSEGSVQSLPNGNVFVGWGPSPYVSEHLPGLPGKAIYFAKLGIGRSYRSFKSPWVGHPTEPPDVFAFQKTCDSPLVIYMSWNGATEYKKWRAYAARGPGMQGTLLGGVADRRGFETVIRRTQPAGAYRPYVYVEALSAKGAVMRTSKHVRVFVPDAALRARCSELRCPDGTMTAKNNAAKHC